MASPRRGAAREILERQREAAERLRLEVLGQDGSLRNPYFRSLERQLRARPHPCEEREVLAACRSARLVFLGEFHALRSCQRFAAEVLAAMATDGPVSLGIEFVYTRQQRALDRRQSGELDDDAFLRRVHWREEWGYAWEGYRELLDRARDLNVPVHALDAPPRGGFDGLARRDSHAARRIAAVLRESSDGRMLVLFGESHLARGHLPAHVRDRLRAAGGAPSVTVFQNPDTPYWRLAGGPTAPRAARLGRDVYAVFREPPLAKYEAYRQVLERWREDVPPEEEVDLTPAVHHLVGVLLDWLGVDPRRRRVSHRAGWSEDLADAIPEVYSGPEAVALLAPILEEHGRSASEVEEATTQLRERGALYEPRSNTFFLMRYLPGRAAAEAARFLRAALSGRLFLLPEDPGVPALARAYGSAYNEALAVLGGRLVDPSSEAVETERRGGPADLPPETVASWLEAHARFEATRRASPPDVVAAPLQGRREERRVLSRALGRRLGAGLFEAVRTGRLSRTGMRRLFERPLPPALAPRTVLDLLRRYGRGERSPWGQAAVDRDGGQDRRG